MGKKNRAPNFDQGYESQFDMEERERKERRGEYMREQEAKKKAKAEAAKAIGGETDMSFSDDEAGKVTGSVKKKKKKKKGESFEEWSEKQRSKDREPDSEKKLREVIGDQSTQKESDRVKAATKARRIEKIKSDALKSRTIRRGVEEAANNRGMDKNQAYEENDPNKYKKAKREKKYILDAREKRKKRQESQDKEFDDSVGTRPSGARYFKKKKQDQDQP